MTNGGGPSHPKPGKKATGKKAKGKDVKASLKRKGWLPAGVAREKNG
jgi:hypothetical protein